MLPKQGRTCLVVDVAVAVGVKVIDERVEERLVDKNVSLLWMRMSVFGEYARGHLQAAAELVLGDGVAAILIHGAEQVDEAQLWLVTEIISR